MAIKFLNEFKEFAMRGNVVDLAVAVVIGGAFGKITTTLVGKIIMPIVGWMTGGINLATWTVTLPLPELPQVAVGEGGEPAAVSEPVVLGIGEFLQVTIDFIIIAFAIFLIIKLLNSLKRKQEEQPKETVTPPEITLLTEIRDELRERRGGDPDRTSAAVPGES